MPPFLKKALISVSLGLFFGVCAGLGFYAVEAATGMLDGGKAETAVSAEISEQADVGKETGEALSETEQETDDKAAASGQEKDIKMTLETAP